MRSDKQDIFNFPTSALVQACSSVGYGYDTKRQDSRLLKGQVTAEKWNLDTCVNFHIWGGFGAGGSAGAEDVHGCKDSGCGKEEPG